MPREARVSRCPGLSSFTQELPLTVALMKLTVTVALLFATAMATVPLTCYVEAG